MSGEGAQLFPQAVGAEHVVRVRFRRGGNTIDRLPNTTQTREKHVLTICPTVRTVFAAVLVALAAAVIGCSEPKDGTVVSGDPISAAEEAGAPSEDSSRPGRLEILYPSDEAVFPPDIVAPTFRWKDTTPTSNSWLIQFAFQNGPEMEFQGHSTEWTPPDESWETIKDRSMESAVEVTIRGSAGGVPGSPISQDRVSISTSRDPVEAPIFFREVNLPFLTAVKDPAAHIRWRYGPISAKQPPPIVLDKMLVCGNCHSFAANGSTLAMEIDSGNDKGSYAIAPIEKQIVLDNSKIISWSDYRKEDGDLTFGLLCQISPDGRYVVGTVKDRALAVYRPSLMFSQLFFLVKGILAIHDREADTIQPLPGADDQTYVQTNATWSPDGKTLVFARAKAYNPPGMENIKSVLVPPEAAEDFVNGTRPFKYDLYRIPFNGGKGGKAEPVEGASNNGMSNYFPKFSPDGKWIVFCRADNFMLLQPDSELYIMPAAGGQPRKLRCNTSRMNSWHSWSPNGKWLVFSSKEYSAYTQLFLTHIDEQGRSSVPVVLSRFTVPERAANIPEFVNAKPDAIQKVTAAFLDDQNYFRAALAFIEQNDPVGAMPLLRKSLEMNPNNLLANREMVDLLWDAGKYSEAAVHVRRLIELLPDDPEAHFRLSAIYRKERRLTEAAEHCSLALKAKPDYFEARASLGLIFLEAGKPEEAVPHLVEAVRMEPKSAFTNFYCGSALHRLGKTEEAVAYYERAIQYNPGLLPALLGLASIHITVDRPELYDIVKALTVAEKACEVTRHENPDALRMLANVYAVAGRLDDAVNTAGRAAEIARAGGSPDLANQIQKMIEVYQKLQADKQKSSRNEH